MNKINLFVSDISHQIHKIYETVTIITQIWHTAKCSMSNEWYLITVPNINKITTFVCELTQQTLKMYVEKTIITQICTEPNSISHASVAHGIWSWYIIWRKSIQSSWRNVQGRPNRCTDRRIDGWLDGLTDRLTDWTLSYIPQFCLGSAGIITTVGLKKSSFDFITTHTKHFN